MSERRQAAKPASAARPSSKSSGRAVSPYGYAWTEWLAREAPDYAEARQAVSTMSVGEGKELSVKHREMVVIGILAFRGSHDGVIAHMRRAIQHGATKRELLEAVQSAAVPGGGPTLSSGVKALMQLEQDGAFRNG